MVDARIPCMTTAFDDTGQHPVTSTIAAVSPSCCTSSPTSGCGPCSAAETETNLTALARCGTRSPSSSSAIAHQADRLDLGAEAGAADTSSYWANATRQTKRDAKRRLELAHALDHDHEPVRDAMAAGQVSEEQAAVIVKGVDALPVEHRRDAEAHLIGLRRRARPGRAAPARTPGPRSGRPRDRRSPRAQGPATPRSPRRGGLPVHHRRRRPRAVPRPVHPAQPRRCHAQAGGARDQLTPAPAALRHPQRARARVLRVRHPLPRRPAPPSRRRRRHRGGHHDPGQPARRQPHPSPLDTGDPITADQARKLACEAGIIPMVLGGKSEVLDLGRRSASTTGHQRIAIRHRDQHCTSHGCEWPAAMCHVHHNIPWSRGGKTDLADGRLLCPRHHSYAHSPEVPDEDHHERTRDLQPDVRSSKFLSR